MSTPINNDLALAASSFEPGAIVYLYTLDLTSLGNKGGVYNFTKNGTCSFGGVLFAQADVEVDGFEWNGRGAMPQPSIRFGNATRLIAGVLKSTGDIVGAKLTRLKTFDIFLDGAPMADSTAIFAPDVYTIEQKTQHNKTMIEFSLSAVMDQQGRMLPGRLILRNLCTFKYRSWSDDLQAFDYTHVTCPYRDPQNFFDINDNPTNNPRSDVCSKRLRNGCYNRFQAAAAIPFGGFPGVARSSAS